MFSYEVPLASSAKSAVSSSSSVSGFHSSSSLVVYNFHNLFSHNRFFFFTLDSLASSKQFCLRSITEFYSNANWLEREISELHGQVFNGKRDLRNLMLQYGDVSAPFQKLYPSVGLKEVFYDAASDLIVQLPLSLQV